MNITQEYGQLCDTGVLSWGQYGCISKITLSSVPTVLIGFISLIQYASIKRYQIPASNELCSRVLALWCDYAVLLYGSSLCCQSKVGFKWCVPLSDGIDRVYVKRLWSFCIMALLSSVYIWNCLLLFKERM